MAAPPTGPTQSFFSRRKKSSKSKKSPQASASSDGSDVNEVKLWASRVVDFSSQYNSSSWSANMALGAPRVYPEYGDIHGAWAQGVCDRSQFLELGFDQKIFIEKINIYETYHGGSVRRVKVREQGNKWTTIWETDTLQVIETARIFSPSFEKLSFRADEVRVETDCSECRSWAEIDAVQIVGTTYNFSPPPSASNLAEDLSILVNNSLFSDVQFQVGKRIFSAHKAILTVRSEFFRAMFCDQMKETSSKEPIPLPGIDSDSFAVVLHFIYTNTIFSDCSCLQLVDVWRVADQFNMEGLQALAICEITTRLDVENVVDVYMKSTSECKLPEITDLKTVCMDFMKIHMKKIVRTDAFTALPQNNMLELIQMMTSALSISE